MFFSSPAQGPPQKKITRVAGPVFFMVNWAPPAKIMNVSARHDADRPAVGEIALIATGCVVVLIALVACRREIHSSSGRHIFDGLDHDTAVSVASYGLAVLKWGFHEIKNIVDYEFTAGRTQITDIGR